MSATVEREVMRLPINGRLENYVRVVSLENQAGETLAWKVESSSWSIKVVTQRY